MELQQNQTTESTTTLHNNEDINNATPENKPKQTLKEKLISIKNFITVEPILFIFLFVSVLGSGATRNMPVEMACRTNRGGDDATCSDFSTALNYVAVDLANIRAWNEPIIKIVTGVLVICFGALSDRYKLRKPFFILPVLGECFSGAGLILCAVFVTQWPVEIFILMASILPAFFGGFQTFLMATYSYISDVSTKEERTARIGFVELVSLVFTPIGPALGGILFLNLGYFGVFFICVLLLFLGILYGLFCVKENRQPTKFKRNICIELFDIKAVIVDMFKVVIRKRIQFRRLLLISTYVCYFLIQGAYGGEHKLIGLYVPAKFKWQIDIAGYFDSFDITFHIIGMFIAVTIFTKRLHLHDITIAAMACIFKIITGIWYAFTDNVYLFLLGPIIGTCNGLYVLALRSFTTKLVEPSEVAKAQALFAICDALSPLIYATVYAKFFEATKEKFAGAFYVLTAALITPALFILLGMYAVHKEDLNNPEPRSEREENGNDIEIERF